MKIIVIIALLVLIFSGCADSYQLKKYKKGENCAKTAISSFFSISPLKILQKPDIYKVTEPVLPA